MSATDSTPHGPISLPASVSAGLMIATRVCGCNAHDACAGEVGSATHYAHTHHGHRKHITRLVDVVRVQPDYRATALALGNGNGPGRWILLKAILGIHAL